MSAGRAQSAVEAIVRGPQSLVPGVVLTTPRDRLVRRAAALREPQPPQQRCARVTGRRKHRGGGLLPRATPPAPGDRTARNPLDFFQPKDL